MTNRRTIFRHFAAICACLALFAVGTSCSKKVKEEASDDIMTGDENSLGDSDSGKALGMQTVHFPYDSFILDSASKSALKANAMILKDKPSITIQVEGHCDSRGGIQYNIALGEKRANAVRKYLADLGVSGERVTVISYGKERLLDQGETEEAHAKNRRANFVITSR